MEIRQLLYTIAIYIAMWILRSFADWWVKKSKATANTFDDYLAANFKKLVDALPIKRKQGNK